MIRLSDMHMVSWAATGISVDIETFQGATIIYEFQDLIGNNFILRPGARSCHVTPLPLNRGIFLDRSVRRIERHGRYQLPYIELAGTRRTTTTTSSRSNESGRTRDRHRRGSPEDGGQSRRHRPESRLDRDSRSGYEGPERSRNRHADATTGTERRSGSPDRNRTSNRDRSRHTNVSNQTQADRLMAAGFRRASQARRTFSAGELDIGTGSGWSRISGFETREIDGHEAFIHREQKIWVGGRDLR
jgi:hypothetical protein